VNWFEKKNDSQKIYGKKNWFE